MKNLKIVIMMFIVNIIGVQFVTAQKQNYQHPKYTGTAFLNPLFEYQKDSATIVDNFKDAFVKAFDKGDVSCFERAADQTPSKPAPEIVRNIQDYFRIKTDNQNLTGHDIAQAILYSTTYARRHKEYWSTHHSAYIEIGTGIIKWWNPLQSSLFNDRTEWIIAFVEINGVTVEIIANCGNLCESLPGAEQFTPNPNPAPQQPAQNYGCQIVFSANPQRIHLGATSTLSWTTTGCGGTVHLDEDATNLQAIDNRVVSPSFTKTYILTTASGQTAAATVYVNERSLVMNQPVPQYLQRTAENNCHTGRTILVVCVAVAVVAIVAYEFLKPKATKDNTYSNGFQLGSGQTTTTGGSGSQQTW